MKSANERQVGGDHYRRNGTEVQHWDYAVMKNLDMFQYQITKYVERWRDKNGIIDLEKAQHFLEKYIEVEKNKCMLAEAQRMKDYYPPQAQSSLAAVVPQQVSAKYDAINHTLFKKTMQELQNREDKTGQEKPFGFEPSIDIGSGV